MAEQKKGCFSILWKVALAILLLLAAAIYWFFYDNRAPSDGEYKLDIAAIRVEADKIEGEKPSAIEVETPWISDAPKIAFVAGTSWDDIAMSGNSYRVVLPGGAVIIDAALDPKTAEEWGSKFDDGAWNRMLTAMSEASHIVITHEHADHIGGLMHNPDLKALRPKLRLTPEQIALPNKSNERPWPEGAFDGLTPTTYDSLLAIAPGVVLIKAPGHTPGTHMIYVQRVDGQEYLFMGDIVSMADNMKLQRIRSRAITDLMTMEDRDEVFRQTKALLTLSKAEPNIVMIPGHDLAAVEAIVKKGLIKNGFTRQAP